MLNYSFAEIVGWAVVYRMPECLSLMCVCHLYSKDNKTDLKQ